jgi:ABC-type amino acid transport substrate-binding protein
MTDSSGTSAPASAPKLKKSNRNLWLGIGAIIVVIILVGAIVITSQPKQTQSTWERVKTSGKLVMWTEASFIPFEQFNASTGKIEGFDIDIAKRVVENLSVVMGKQITLDLQDKVFSTIPAALQSGQADLSFSGWTITAERNKTVLFSTPYIADPGFGLLVKTTTSNINSVADLAGKKIVVNTGTTAESWVQENLIDTGLEPADKVRSLATIDLCVQDVQIGQSDVFIIDTATCYAYVQKAASGANPLKVTATITSDEQYGACMNREATDLCYIVNMVINGMIESGEMHELKVKWNLAG